MVFFGVGVLVVTLSLILYKYKTTSAWAGKDIPQEIHQTSQCGEEDTDAKERPSIPNITLNEGHDKSYVSVKEQDAFKTINPSAKSQSKPAPQSQAADNSERVSMLPPPASNPKQKHEESSTAPILPRSRPTPKVPIFKSPAKPSTPLRPPPSAASTLRGPPSRSLAPTTTSLAPTTSTLAPSSRPSKKVILEPGHSPLDWAHLTHNPPTPTFLRGKDVPPQLIRVPPSLLRYHSGRKGKDAWGVYQGRVYNLTPYMKFHPGGVDQLMRGAGKERDGERLFNEIHPWVNWENMLGECLVGILVSENEVHVSGETPKNTMEEMD
ncbi:hypothetical protein JMJ35_001271 [Cladonia borealis]|uniref:Cytochrome b5 heme-binding domain-containing protein n=1 Tax=Cladonia borealis TaxID=184061 RepID=A0AA39RAU2_9LECA|nr:hypothetical protein JMJ35_001271 [Cladonia borealis]